LRIDHRFKDVESGSKWVRVVVNTVPGDQFEVKAHLNVKGKEWFSDETDYSLESALIRTVEELIVMIEKDTDNSAKRTVELTAQDLLEDEIKNEENVVE